MKYINENLNEVSMKWTAFNILDLSVEKIINRNQSLPTDDTLTTSKIVELV